jgi:hypothetical protein
LELEEDVMLSYIDGAVYSAGELREMLGERDNYLSKCNA